MIPFGHQCNQTRLLEMFLGLSAFWCLVFDFQSADNQIDRLAY